MTKFFGRLGVLALAFLIFSGPIWATPCEKFLLEPLELAQGGDLKTLSPEGARAYYSKRKPKLGEPAPKFTVLEGFKLTNRMVLRSGRELGLLARSPVGRSVIFEPLPANVSIDSWLLSFAILERLSSQGLAVPVLGLAHVGAQFYFVRPIVYGEAPLAHLASEPYPAKLQQLFDLEEIGKVLEAVHRTYVYGGIMPRNFSPGETIDAEFEKHALDLEYAIALNSFLDQIKFVEAPGGHLWLESLPHMVTNYPLNDYFPVTEERTGQRWPLQRWNWYRYLLAARLEESEKTGFVNWLHDKSRIEWMMRFQALGRLVQKSPEFIGPRVKMAGVKFQMISDLERPHPRPAELKFKNMGLWVGHFEKHGNESRAATKEEYLNQARNFVLAPPNENRLYYERKNGDILLTDKVADELAVFTRAGRLRTYMRPSVDYHGHSANYFYLYEQILLDEGFLD